MSARRLADRPRARARLRRRGFPIHGYVGPNGTGKSAVMVYDTLPSLDHGRRVLSTVRLLDYRDPHACGEREWDRCDDEDGHEVSRGSGNAAAIHRAAHPLYVRFTSYEQLLAWRDGDVLMDEVTGVASSRETASMPVQVANYLVQLRRRNVALRWTAPAWGRADKIIREVSQGVTLTSAFLPKRPQPQPGEPPMLWSQRRIILARTYDPLRMDEFEAHRAEHIRHLVQAAYWGPGSLMFDAYDTLDAVTALGWASEAGMCMTCGGKRQAPRCTCEPERHRAGRRDRERGAAA